MIHPKLLALLVQIRFIARLCKERNFLIILLHLVVEATKNNNKKQQEKSN
jgi:hypothetical protein